MSTDIPKQYNPADCQTRWLEHWEKKGYFNADPDSSKKPHTIMIPLPNVTGALHMGHALNGTCQDLLTRWKRMQGYVALWMPGTDHAGIATQAVVERRMKEEENLTRHDIGREALVKRIWEWKDSYEKRILNQLKQLGASCDWRRTRFTLDDVCSKAVRRTFFKLFEDGNIFRGKRLVNWDTFLQTAVANDEVFHETIKGGFWTFSYPVVGSDEKISFSTTRPETMLGDSAVCVHPNDERYAHLVGKSVCIPVTGREIPVIADGQLAKMELGTGAVKVTPAHDHNDYACGLRNNLEMINILNPDGTINDIGGEKYEGLDRYDARQKIIEEMEQLGFYGGTEEREIELAQSDRSKTPVEPYLSDQWFVKMDELAQSAMDAVEDGRVTFYPARYAKTYLDWLGEKRDWCISRQLWWGHRIPIWYCETCTEEELQAAFGDKEGIAWKRNSTNTSWLICSETDLSEDAMGEQHQLIQDEDVLDTWFSSALWPHATLGWPQVDQNPPLNNKNVDGATDTSTSTNEVLDFFYPGSVLVTSRDIITLWVARMVLTGLYNMGEIPFSHVCIHPKILDSFGQGMSKSKGNGVDPLDIIDKYGTDAMRFTIASLAGQTQDVRMPVGYECPHCQAVIPQTVAHQKATPDGGEKPRVQCDQCKKESQYNSAWFTPDEGEPVARVVSERFEYGRNFCNKLWNASRFAMLNLEGYTPGIVEQGDLQMEDRWIFSRLSTVTTEVTNLLNVYQFDAATRTIREFVWNEFCDWYIEMIKPRLYDDDLKPIAQRVLVGVLDTILRLMHPFIPFVTEELWHRLAEFAPQRGLMELETATESIMIAPWVDLPVEWKNDGLEKSFKELQEIIVAVRNVRAEYHIPPSTPLQLQLRCDDTMVAELQKVASQFENLVKTTVTEIGAHVEPPADSAKFSLGDIEGYIPLEGTIDREAELTRLEKESQKLNGFIKGHSQKLANDKFVSNAPEKVVNDVKETLAGLEKQRELVEESITQLRKNSS